MSTPTKQNVAFQQYLDNTNHTKTLHDVQASVSAWQSSGIFGPPDPEVLPLVFFDEETGQKLDDSKEPPLDDVPSRSRSPFAGPHDDIYDSDEDMKTTPVPKPKLRIVTTGLEVSEKVKDEPETDAAGLSKKEASKTIKKPDLTKYQDKSNNTQTGRRGKIAITQTSPSQKDTKVSSTSMVFPPIDQPEDVKFDYEKFLTNTTQEADIEQICKELVNDPELHRGVELYRVCRIFEEHMSVLLDDSKKITQIIDATMNALSSLADRQKRYELQVKELTEAYRLDAQ